MSWNPVEKLSDIMALERDRAPVPVEWYSVEGGEPRVTQMQVGERYCIATEIMPRALATVTRLNHGAVHPIQLQFVNEYGDSMLDWFSPDELLMALKLS